MIIVTGGLGYIGSHVVKALIDFLPTRKVGSWQPLGLTPGILIVDNLSNSSSSRLTDQLLPYAVRNNVNIKFVEEDVRNLRMLARLVASIPSVEAIIHCAGVKSVAESEDPVLRSKYMSINVDGTRAVAAVAAIAKAPVIFSSSATVYGDTGAPFREDSPLRPANFYGETKKMAEQYLSMASGCFDFPVVALRYFNPIGAEFSPPLVLAENPKVPTNLLPLLCKAAVNGTPISIFGTDYPTPDGTALRDYIDVRDVATAHVKALNWLTQSPRQGLTAFNIGTGVPISVAKLIDVFNCAGGRTEETVQVRNADRRAGDPAVVYASVTKAQQELQFAPTVPPERSCIDALLAYKASELGDRR